MPTPDPPLTPPPGARPALPGLGPSLLLYALVAVVIDLGALHRLHTSDDLVFVLASLYAWTPFFWEQDRVGLLLPLLASPFNDPLTNLLIQNGLSVFAGLASSLLLARYLFRQPFYPLVAALANAGLLLLVSEDVRYNLFINCCYGTALSLGVGGLVLTEPGPDGRVPWPRCLAAMALIALSEWVYVGGILLLAPLAVSRWLLMANRPPADPDRPRWRALLPDAEARWAVAALAFGAAVGLWLKSRAGVGTDETPLVGLYLGEWPKAWQQMALNLWTALAPGHWPILLGAAAVVGLGLQAWLGLRPACPVYRAAAVAALAGLGKGLFLGTRTWLYLNLYAYRYLLPTLLCVQVALLAIALAPLADTLAERGRRLLLPLSAVVLLAAALATYGWPSVDGVRTDLDKTLGQYTGDILAGDCQFVSGDYWQVWMAVYHANLTLHERGEPRTVWGVGSRGKPMSRCWQDVPNEDRRIAVPRGQRAAAEGFLAAYGFGPVVRVEELPHIEVLRPAHRKL
jgi:hypothetical protein